MLDSLSRLLNEGRLGRLEVVNVAAHPEAAIEAGTRTVPWTRIGPFELAGLYPRADLAAWAEHAAQGTGMAAYLAHLLEQHQLGKVVGLAERTPGALAELIGLAGSLETPMGIRIGIGAVVEELAGTAALRKALPGLRGLAASPEPAVRADGAHYLGLTGSPQAREPLESLLADPDAQVREIATESLALLMPAPSH